MYGIFIVQYKKALKPKLSQHNIKKWWHFQSSILKYKFAFKNARMGNLNAKMGKKCLNWQHVAQYLLPKKWFFKCQNIFFSIFTPIKNTSVKASMKLTLSGLHFVFVEHSDIRVLMFEWAQAGQSESISGQNLFFFEPAELNVSVY